LRQVLLTAPPPAEFTPDALFTEDRGTHEFRKLTLNLTGDSRVAAFMTLPKGRGPFPAVLLLHDHGAYFVIGKEKVIRPPDDDPRFQESLEWQTRYYGGRSLGDELAKRGYVCFATDMLNWGDRAGAGYDGQQALACNLMQMGMTFAGLIAHEDLRAVEFLAAHPQVDATRIAAMGLSVGCYRTWQVAALTDTVKAGVAVCWMASYKGLLVPGQNQTVGQSAFTMIHPGLASDLDYPDAASIACPKPMLFYNGTEDGLFPVASVEASYAKMRKVWESQGVGERLETRLWNVPHVFNRQMQDEAFEWLDRHLGVGPTGKR
jgi:dienelactone hydrolase